MTQQVEPIGKTELLQRIRSEHERLEATLSRLSPEQWLQPNVEGAWSPKDTIAHLSAWEGRVVRWSGEALGGQVPELPVGEQVVDQINAQIYADNRERPLAEVRAEFDSSHSQVLRAVEDTAEADMSRTGLFEAWGDIPLWKFFSILTWQHYEMHHQPIRAWLEGLEAS
jgi:hypothetical protein